MRLAGKIAIISGAASGIGAATARIFAREGAKVVVADLLEDEGRKVVDALGAAARFERLDVADETPPDQAARAPLRPAAFPASAATARADPREAEKALDDPPSSASSGPLVFRAAVCSARGLHAGCP